MDTIKCDLCGLWNEATEKACRRCGVIFPGRETSVPQLNLGAGVAGAKHFTDPIKNPRVFAGTWFANAASIPAGIFVLITTLSTRVTGWYNGIAFMAIALAVIIAWAMGYYFGSKILDESRVITPGRASALGLGVAALSFVLYIAAVSLIISIADARHGDYLSTFFSSFALLLFFGSLLVGWFVAIVGLTAGYSLYRYRLSHGVAVQG
ncbi:MAG: hypothetical protein WCB68_16645 [Pyrinomonadaceae bacterium]